MSFMLMLIYYFTLFEILIALILLSPFKLLRNFCYRLINSSASNFYFRIFVLIVSSVIIVIFFDSLNEVRYLHNNIETSDNVMYCQNIIRYCISQSYLYITGLSLFSSIVIIRATSLFAIS